MDFILQPIASIIVMNCAYEHRSCLVMERIPPPLCLARCAHHVSTPSIRTDDGNAIRVKHDQIQERILTLSIGFQRAEKHTRSQTI